MRLALIVVVVGCVIAATGRSAGADEGEPPDPRGPEPPVWVVMPPPPEAAPREATPAISAEQEDEEAHEGRLENGGAEVALGTLVLQPALGRAVFTGEGTPIGGVRRESFRHTGRQLGLDAPLMWGGELSFHYLRRYFAIGLMGFIAGNPAGRGDAVPIPSSSIAADQVSTRELWAYGGGIDLAGAVPLGPVAFRAGGVLGLRGFSVPMTGFEKTTCHTKRNTYPCNENATTSALLFFEPRLRAEISPAQGFFFGAYVGMEMLASTGPTAGLFLGLQTPHSTLRP